LPDGIPSASGAVGEEVEDGPEVVAEDVSDELESEDDEDDEDEDDEEEAGFVERLDAFLAKPNPTCQP
jgi:hypothetical protein